MKALVAGRRVLVTGAGGTIGAENMAGHGSEFVVRMPRSK